MYVTNVRIDYDNITSSNYTDHDNMTLTNCTNNENIIEKVIPLTTIIPGVRSLLCLISPMVYTSMKTLFNNKMEKILYPSHPVRCIITGPSECGKSVFLTNLILIIDNEYDKIYIYSPSLHQNLYQKLIKCF